jgi:hypothetical protein
VPLKTLLARTTAVLLASGFAAATVIALEPAGPAAAVAVAPQVTTVAGTGTVSGTVTTISGAVVNGETVSLVDATSGAVAATATTAADGTYTTSAATPGTYYVQFNGNPAYQAQYLGGSQVANGSISVTLTSTTSVIGANALLQPWNYPGITQTVTATQTVTTGTPGITIVQSAPTATVTTPAKTVTVTRTVTTPAKTVTTTTSAGSSTAPSVASGSLGGIGARAVALKFKVDAGVNTGGLKSFEVKLPKGFSFVAKKLKTGLKLGKLHFTYKLTGNALSVTLKSAQKTFSASFGGGAITTTAVIARHAKLQKIASEKISLTVTDAKGTRTSAPFVIAEPS